MYRFIGKWHDLLLGIASTLVVLVVGSYLAYKYQPVWLNRAGSLIIIIGVILAVNRIHEIYEKRFVELFDKTDEKGFVGLVEQNLERPLVPEERKDLIGQVRKTLIDQLQTRTTERKRIFRYFEIWLIIVGTFLNGFGDYLVCMFRVCDS